MKPGLEAFCAIWLGPGFSSDVV